MALRPVAAALVVAWLTVAPSAAAAELPPELEAAIAAVERPACGEDTAPVRKLCAQLAARLGALEGDDRATGLESLLRRCREALPVVDEVAVAMAEQALAARRDAPTAAPAELVKDLAGLAYKRLYQSRNDEALELCNEAVELARHEIGEDSEPHAFALERLSAVLSDMGRYDDAMVAAQRSRQIREAASPVDVARLAEAINAVANVHYARDALESARQGFAEALARSRALPDDDETPIVRGRFANNLGEVEFRLGRTAEALTALEEARALREATPTRLASRNLASTLTFLGEVHASLGDYGKAVDSFAGAVAGHRCWTGTEPHRLADSLTRLATALEESGDAEGARERIDEAIRIRRAAVSNHPAGAAADPARHRQWLLLASSLTRLGELQHRMGDAAAGPTLTGALAIQEAELAGRPDTALAETLLALARLEMDAGARAAAAGRVARAVKVLTAVAAEHPLLVDAYELQTLLDDDGDSAAALAVVDEALQLAGRIHGADSPKVADLWTAKALLRRRHGDRDGAAAAAATAQAISRDHLVAVIQAFPGEQALAFAGGRKRSLDVALAVLGDGADGVAPDTLARVWEAMAGSRAVVFDAQADRQRLVHASGDPMVGARAEALIAARRRLAVFLVRSVRAHQSGGAELARLKAEVREAEAAVARATSRLAPAAPAARLTAVATALPPGSSLVSYARFVDPDGGAARYSAFVVAAGRPLPSPVSLGPAAAIDDLVEAWRAEVGRGGGGDPAVVRRTGEALRALVWDPLAAHLGDASVVFLVPDGSLNLVSFPALPLADGRFVIEDGRRFHLLATERDALAAASARRGEGLLLVGAVDYDDGPPRPKTLAGPTAVGRAASCRADLPFFARLPATAGEIDEVARLWRGTVRSGSAADVLRGAEAGEAQLSRGVVGKRIVHLATHGFVGLGHCGGGAGVARGMGAPSSLASPAVTGDAGLSGLALSGANRGESDTPGDDGVLLAEEVVDLDLRDVEWVVLSACESGLGSVAAGEGVMGLRRAFQVAGARTLISSLWPIDDEATHEWMRRLYELRLRDGATTVDAVHRASLQSLAARRQRGLSTNPFYWAAFTAAGDWR